VSVRFLPEEKEYLNHLAKEQHLTLSQFLRLTALKQVSKMNINYVPQVNRQLYQQLGRVAETVQTTELSSDLITALQELLDEVRRELIGLWRAPEQCSHPDQYK
jgi:hypothetical protein